MDGSHKTLTAHPGVRCLQASRVLGLFHVIGLRGRWRLEPSHRVRLCYGVRPCLSSAMISAARDLAT